MRRIYKKASQVRVWLGENSEHSEEAMQLINNIAFPPRRAPGEEEVKYPELSEKQVERNRKALQQFFQRYWFERAWIRQEVSLKQNITMSWGDSTTNIGNLELAIKAVDYIATLKDHAPLTNEGALNMSWLNLAEGIEILRKDTACGERYVSLSRLLLQARGCQSSNDKDKVYSMLGLADPEIHQMQANYDLEAREVFMKAARSALSQAGGLYVLVACQNPERAHGLPSWTPNLTDAWKYQPFREAIRTSLTSGTRQDVNFEDDTLLIKGYDVGKVNAICAHTVSSTANPEEIEAVYNSWQEFMAQQRKLYDKFEGAAYRGLSVAQLLPGRPIIDKDRNPAEDSEKDLAIVYPRIDLRNARALLLPANYAMKADPMRNTRASMKKHATNRRLGYTAEGKRPGLFPGDVRIGDTVALFHGSNHPFVLREISEANGYVLVGDVHFPLTTLTGSTLARLPSKTFRLV
jgi:Heterokaryon incompatibility protein (HET)